VPQDPSKLGGLKGGKARAEKLTKEERFKSARKAAKARWEKKCQQEEFPNSLPCIGRIPHR
jgi:hypothetical protein